MTAGRHRPPQACLRPNRIRALVAVVLAAAAVAPVAAEAPATRFRDATPGSGIAFESGMRGIDGFAFVDLMARTSAAAGDYDGDGDVDLFIVRGDIGPNLLYRNDGGLRFTEVASAAGLAFTRPPADNYRHAGPTFADIDGDGDLDLFVGGLQGDPSRLYRNDGDGTFTDVTRHSGLDAMSSEQTFSAAFGDYDLDGDLDLALAHWGTARPAILYVREASARRLFTEHLWRNDSDAQGIRFTRVSDAAGIAATILTLPDPEEPFPDGHPSLGRDWTFTPTFARIDGDRYPDLLFVADFNRSQVFLNNRDGTFRNVTDPAVLIDDHGMGSAVADFDNDGDLDWFVTSVYYGGPGETPDPFRGNRLYRNDGGVFADATDAAGVVDGGWGWAACAIDFDNDGNLDIYHTNGWISLGSYEADYTADRSRAFVGRGDGTFTDRAAALGLDDSEFGRGAVCADFDNDGDVDILLLHESATLWENLTADANYLRVLLRGAPPNTEAVGARISVTTATAAGTRTRMRELTLGSNYLSQNPLLQVFGLGAATECDVEVEWPDGRRTSLRGVSAGQTLHLTHPALL